MAELHLHILGTPRVTTGQGVDLGLPAGKPLALLAMVALESGGVTRNDAAALLWPGSPVDRARASVRQALWTLRKRLDAEVLAEDADGRIRADPQVLTTDLATLEAAIRAGDAQSVVDLWRGGPFQGFAIADAPAWNQWASEVHTRWETRAGSFLESHALSVGVADRLRWITHALALRPYRDALRALRVETLLELGWLEEAEEALAEARAELGEDEEGAFARLDREIRAAIRARYRDEEEQGLPLAFVGRSGEFAALSDLWRAVRDGHARTANILGAPGMGKTRLAQEFLAVASASDATVVRVRGTAAERQLEYGMASALVRELLALPGAAGISNASADALRALVPSAGTRPGASVSRPAAAALADALADLLDAVAEEARLALLVDDLHWVDIESRTVLQRALRLTPRRPILLIQTCRTEEGDASVLRTLRLQAGAPEVRTLELAPLTPEDVVELLTGMAAFPSEVAASEAAASLHRASRGHPLHLVSLIRSLRDDGVLERRDGDWIFVMARLPSELEMPRELRELLARRVGSIGEDARAVLGAMSRNGTSARLGDIRREVGLSEVRFTEAVGELLAADLIRWLDGHSVEFTHDLVREEVIRSGVPAALESRWRMLGILAAMIVVVAGAVWTLDRFRPASGAPWAQGEILAATPQGLYVLRPGPGGRWVLADSFPQEARPEGDFIPVGFGTGGRVIGSHRRQLGGPDLVERLPDGTLSLLLDRGGDESTDPSGLSPDGRWVLVMSEDTAATRAGTYRLDLVRVDLASGERRVLHRPQMSASTAWSPSGRFVNVSVSTYAAPDSVFRLRPDGSVASAFEFPPGASSSSAACGETGIIFTNQRPRELPRWYSLDWETRAIEPLPLGVLSLASGVTCSPDGAFLAVFDLATIGMRILDRRTGQEVAAVEGLEFQSAGLYWRGGTADVPGSVTAALSDSVVPWGGHTSLAARVANSLGHPWQGPVTWQSLDPEIATVRGTRVIANAPGTARIVATADGWLRDTVSVRVSSDQSGTLLLGDRFQEFPGEAWIALGDPQPSTVELDGATVLSMNSDAVFADGMVSAASFPAAQGLTLEMQFRLPLTDRMDRQSVTLCLWEADPPIDADPAWVPNWRARDQYCVRYPADELTGFDPTAMWLGPDSRLGIQGVPAPGFGGEEWVEFGLQLRADGRLSAIANGEEVAVHPLLFDIDPDTRFRVLVLGRTADTELQARNLNLWRGARY